MFIHFIQECCDEISERAEECSDSNVRRREEKKTALFSTLPVIAQCPESDMDYIEP